jgi:hypothetical protein
VVEIGLASHFSSEVPTLSARAAKAFGVAYFKVLGSAPDDLHLRAQRDHDAHRR